MKRLWCLALLFGSAHAAEITIELSASCAGFTSKWVSASGCPCNLSAGMAGPNVSNTQIDGSVTLTGDNCDGTIHACVDNDADPAITRDACINNTGMESKQTKASTGAGSYSFSAFTGLSAETLSKMSFFLVPSGSYTNRPEHDVENSNSFTTLAAPGGGGTDLTGAGLFIAQNDGGNTDETPTGTSGTQTSGCTSMANSCSQFSHIGTPATGTNVYLAEGSDITGPITINFEGSSSDEALFGCYFDEGDDDGNPVECSNF